MQRSNQMKQYMRMHTPDMAPNKKNGAFQSHKKIATMTDDPL